MIAEALAELGLPAGLADAAHDPAYDEAVRRSHDAGARSGHRRLCGHAHPPCRRDASGSGPVLRSVPRGEQAAELFDSFRVLAG